MPCFRVLLLKGAAFIPRRRLSVFLLSCAVLISSETVLNHVKEGTPFFSKYGKPLLLMANELLVSEMQK